MYISFHMLINVNTNKFGGYYSGNIMNIYSKVLRRETNLFIW